MIFRIALRNLQQHRRRTLFLGTALAAVTALLVLLSGITHGVREAMLHTAVTLSTGHLNVGGFFKVTAGSSTPAVTNYPEVLKTVRKVLPELKHSVQRSRGWAKVVSDQGAVQTGVIGIDIHNEIELKKVLQIVSGNIEDLAQPNTIMLFERHLEKLEVKVGDAITISAQTNRGINNTIDCRVVAIAKNVGLLSQWSTFVPKQTLHQLYQLRDDTTGAIQLHLKPEALANLGPLAARLRQALADAGYRVMEPDSKVYWMKVGGVNRQTWTGQKLDVSTWEDELSFMTWTIQVLQAMSTVLMLILMAILCAGIMNTLWIAIRERTREIGTLRAIGMQRGSVARLFMVECLLLGLMGTGVGAALGVLVALGLNALHIEVPMGVQVFLMSDRLHVAIEPRLLIQAIVLLSLVTTLAGLYPSIRAARLRPVEAMARFG